MDDQHYRENTTIQYCFPDHNASCIRVVNEGPGYFILCFIFSCISVCTVVLNLLVIISISHFKQLHTPTNLTILSLSVADFLVGLVSMPVDLHSLTDTCWYLGKLACNIYQMIGFVSMYGSLYSVILIAVDRYIAITDPLQYSSQITLQKTLLSIILGWSFCLFYVIVYVYFNEYFFQSQAHCYGSCILNVNYYWAITELVFAFIAPFCFILILYSVIFKVAIHQAKAVRAVKNGASNNSGAKITRSSEIKAAKKLGTVIFVFLACWIAFFVWPVSVHASVTVSMLLALLIDMNSFVNPLMYAIFYPWFRASVKYIVTCKIFESSSSRLNFVLEH